MSLIQREGRPKLDLTPDETPDTAAWDEHYGNVGMNPMNNPSPIHTGDWPVNGWTKKNEHNEPDATDGGVVK
jgi:hypothetical protein